MNEIINETTIDELTRKFGFECTLIGNEIKVKSKYDVWYFSNEDYDNTHKKIRLYHENNWGKGFKHYQGTYHSLELMFSDIDKHDNKYNKCFGNVFRVKELLLKLEKGAGAI